MINAIYREGKLQKTNIRIHILLLVLWVLLPCYAYALDLNKELNSLLDKEKDFNGVVLVAKGDELIFSKTKGFSDIATRDPIRPDSQFIIGSVSKQFTAVLIMKGVEDGKLELNTPIIKYLPSFKESWAKEVTIHHLLTHSSGAMEAGKPLEFKPGTKRKYSNYGYDLLGKILERVEDKGKRYPNLIKQVSQSCHMTGTFASKSATINEIRKEHPKLVIGYDRLNDGSLEEEAGKRDFFKNPSRGVISNAKDLITWNKCIWQGHYLKSDTIKLMTTPYFKHENHRWNRYLTYGYGIQILKKGDLYELSHNGFTKGYITTLLYYPDLQLSLVVLENVAPKDTEEKSSVLYKVHDKIRAMLRTYLVEELTAKRSTTIKIKK